MIHPKKLKKGDTVAVVSLSWGGLGDESLYHKYLIAKDRLENVFNLKVKPMPHALKGSSFVYEHPELRAKDLMDAFLDDEVAAVFCAIGGDDTVRTLPYVDLDVIRDHPKIFMGYSDSTINHFMMNKAGLISFYGPSVMCEFGEYVKMFDYTRDAVQKILFDNEEDHEVLSSPVWSGDYVPWKEENINIGKKLIPDTHGYEVLSGSGVIKGALLGGCIDVFPMVVGTSVWPDLDGWRDRILLIETSEDKPAPDFVKWYMRNLGAQGILGVIKGILVGKPQGEEYYDEYKDVYLTVLREFGVPDLPVLYNVNIGHAYPIGILPLGSEVTVDLDRKRIFLSEKPLTD